MHGRFISHPSFLIFLSFLIFYHCPMQLVVPSVVQMAVRTVMTNWIICLQVSFFISGKLLK